MIVSIEYNLMVITAFQFLLLAIFLISHQSAQKLNNRLFSAFLFGKGTLLSFNLLLGANLFLVKLFYFPMLFIYTPFLYLFILSKTTKNFQFKPVFWLHFIPVVIMFSINMASMFFKIERPSIYPIYATLLYYCQAITYSYLAFTAIKKFNINSETKRLLGLLMLGFIVIMILFLMSFLVIMFKVELSNVSHLLNSLGLIMLFMFANGIVFISLKHPELYSEQRFKAKVVAIPKAVNEQSATGLKLLMEQEQLYLNPNLTIQEVAERLNIHQRTLSLLLKHIFKKNFLEFINSYRIQHAVHAIENNGNNSPLIEIQLNSAFNSKSVFNSAFKKHTGLTPSAYKKSQLRKIKI